MLDSPLKSIKPLQISLTGLDYCRRNSLVSLLCGPSKLRPVREAMDADFLRHDQPKTKEDVDALVVEVARMCTKRRDEIMERSFTSAGSAATMQAAEGHECTLPGYVLDQSTLIVRAMCAARISIEEGVDLDTANARIEEILSASQTSFPLEQVRILLKQVGGGKVVEHDVGARKYETVVSEAVRWQEERGAYTHIVERAPGETLLETLQKVVEAIRASVDRPTLFPHLLPTLECCVAFGGLSECGKSTTATKTVEAFAARWGPGTAVRLKIGFLLDMATERLGHNVYDLSDHEQAVQLVHSLHLFLRWHKWVTFVTLESLHQLKSTESLRQLIGFAVSGEGDSGRPGAGKYIVAYLETSLENRMSRTEAEGKHFDTNKDVLKMSRGADKIKKIADVVVDNNGDAQATVEQVLRAVERLSARLSSPAEVS